MNFRGKGAVKIMVVSYKRLWKLLIDKDMMCLFHDQEAYSFLAHNHKITAGVEPAWEETAENSV